MKWNGRGERMRYPPTSLPATNGRRIQQGLGVSSCDHHIMRAKDSLGLPQEPSQTSWPFLLPLLYFRPSLSSFKSKTLKVCVNGWQVYWDPEPRSLQVLLPLPTSCLICLFQCAIQIMTFFYNMEKVGTHLPHDLQIASWLASLSPVSIHFTSILLPESCSKIRLSLSLKISYSSSPKTHCLPMSHRPFRTWTQLTAPSLQA